jgi:hypothetical protein
MPTVTETMVDGYAHCNDGRCPGNKQDPVKVVQTVTEFSYFDLGGDVPGIERSVDSIRFADIADAQCVHCGEPRACADQKRPIYPNVSGIPQDRLLNSGRDTERLHELQLSDARREAEMAQMRALMERQNATIERLMALQETRAVARPKRAPTE